ncbi:MAG: 6-phosphogluconolactonase [Betaproteobacteria bacterium]|jgi:6-phosphogluconolactonase|nr:6-phosphogluconolactonase [Betaproteobacteria bacterium]
MGRLVRLPERTALDRACAAWLARRLQSGAGPVVFAACGGRSVDGILAALPGQAGVPWERVHVFLVDERVVPAGHADSNLRQLHAGLVAPLASAGLLPAGNLHAFAFPQHPSVAAEAAAVESCNRALRALGGRFDAVLLSAGEDGHVAALFPGHRSFDDPAQGYIRFDDSPKPPASRVSASRALLLRSRAAALVFAGESKRAALAGFIACGRPDPDAGLGRLAVLDRQPVPACLVRALPEWAAFTDLDHR